MENPFLYGIGVGVTLAFLVGPVFFTLLQTSLEKGFWAGFFFAVGIALCDACYIGAGHWGLSHVADLKKLEFGLGVFGGIFLIFFGIKTFFKKSYSGMSKLPLRLKKWNYVQLVTKGFLINGINPSVPIFWIGVISVVSMETSFDGGDMRTFYVSVIATVFFTDLIKVFLASRIKHFISPVVLFWINRIIGTVVVCLGIIMLLKTLR